LRSSCRRASLGLVVAVGLVVALVVIVLFLAVIVLFLAVLLVWIGSEIERQSWHDAPHLESGNRKSTNRPEGKSAITIGQGKRL